MRKTLFSMFLLLSVKWAVFAGQHQDNSAFRATFVGRWIGTWGIGTGEAGKLDVTFTESESGKLSARLVINSVRGLEFDGVFQTVEVSGSWVQMKFEAPRGDVEITVEASVENGTLKGEYVIRDLMGNEEWGTIM